MPTYPGTQGSSRRSSADTLKRDFFYFLFFHTSSIQNTGKEKTGLDILTRRVASDTENEYSEWETLISRVYNSDTDTDWLPITSSDCMTSEDLNYPKSASRAKSPTSEVREAWEEGFVTHEGSGSWDETPTIFTCPWFGRLCAGRGFCCTSIGGAGLTGGANTICPCSSISWIMCFKAKHLFVACPGFLWYAQNSSLLKPSGSSLGNGRWGGKITLFACNNWVSNWDGGYGSGVNTLLGAGAFWVWYLGCWGRALC